MQRLKEVASYQARYKDYLKSYEQRQRSRSDAMAERETTEKDEPLTEVEFVRGESTMYASDIEWKNASC